MHRADHEEQEAAAAQPAGHRGRWKEEDLHGLDSIIHPSGCGTTKQEVPAQPPDHQEEN